MKKAIVVFMALLLWPALFAGNSENISVTSGNVLTSSGDSATTWTTNASTFTSALALGGAASARLATYTFVAEAAEPGKRYVSIWIIDQDETVPLENSILYEKPMVFTDKTPDEIRAGIPLLSLLETHNKFRETLKDKDGKVLKKIRLRDLQIIIRNW
jgi:hypothetical protein